MTIFSDEEIHKKIQSWGIPLEKIFLIGPTDESYCLIGLWIDDVGFRFHIIEDNELARRCVSALQRLVRHLESNEDVVEIAKREKWPGSER